MGIFGKIKHAILNAAYRTWTSSDIVDLGKCNFDDYKEIYANGLIQACISANARHTSKASARVFQRDENGIKETSKTKQLQRLLNYTPNPYMDGQHFLMLARTLYEMNNIAFVFVDKTESGEVIAYYPIIYDSVEAYVDVLYNVTGYRFNIRGAQYTFHNADLVVIHKNLRKDGVFGMSDEGVKESLNMLRVSDKGMENAIKLTSSLRGILKSTKGMIDREDTKRTRDDFVKDYVNMANESGIAALDGTYEYTPISLDPKTANAVQIALYEKRVMRSYGTNEKILMNEFDENTWNAYYEGSIEPFLIGLSIGMTNKSFSLRERGFNNEIAYGSNRLLYASAQTKLGLTALVDRGLMSRNEFRETFALTPVAGGDEMVIRKEYEQTKDLKGESESEN